MLKICCVLIAFAVCANAALDPEFIQEIKQAMKKKLDTCAAQVNAGPDDVAMIMDRKLPTSHEGKCIFFCIHKMMNVQNEQGVLQMDSAMESISFMKDVDEEVHGKLVGIFKSCESSPHDADPCIYASNLVECLIREGKAAGFKESLLT